MLLVSLENEIRIADDDVFDYESPTATVRMSKPLSSRQSYLPNLQAKFLFGALVTPPTRLSFKMFAWILPFRLPSLSHRFVCCCVHFVFIRAASVYVLLQHEIYLEQLHRVLGPRARIWSISSRIFRWKWNGECENIKFVGNNFYRCCCSIAVPLHFHLFVDALFSVILHLLTFYDRSFLLRWLVRWNILKFILPTHFVSPCFA